MGLPGLQGADGPPGATGPMGETVSICTVELDC